jgi:PPK2 family polyphosphate:nucleotide phosphotransferase
MELIEETKETSTNMNYLNQFRVIPGKRVQLKDYDPGFHDSNETKKSGSAKLVKLQERLDKLQYKLYAEKKRSLLICLQGPDAGGKDGVIRHAFASMNPQGCRVASFKQPSAVELEHDFLWRIELESPKRGEVVIFNRSQYEDVLVARVHDLVPKEVWSKRYEEINALERRLRANGTQILKFFLHISMEEQLERFEKRIEDPDKRWKISEADYKERKFWPAYNEAYEEALSRCSTADAPWFVIPSNHKWFRDLAISQIVVETLENLGIEVPVATVDIDGIRRKYHKAVERAKT